MNTKYQFKFIIYLVFTILALIAPKSVFAEYKTALGLHVGTINTGTTLEADQIISQAKGMGVKSVRLIYQNPITNITTAYVVKQLNEEGIDVLITIMPHSSDYSDIKTSYSNYPNGSSEFENLCGSPGWKWMYKYSTIDQSLYKSRLESLLFEINRQGGSVAAFELGNETDWACFNGDIPVIPATSGNDPYDLSQTGYLRGTVRGYAATLKTTYQTIKAIHPPAAVLTFGAANTYLYDNKKPHLNYPNFLLWLSDVDGVNYLTTYSDATAMHFYPQVISTSEIANIIGPAFTNAATYRNKFWITEFGFGKSLPQYVADPTNVEKLRFTTFQNFMDAVNGLNQIIVERAYLYSYEASDWTIMSGDKSPLLSADIFKKYLSPQVVRINNYLAGDLNWDGKVNIFDYNLLHTNYGKLYNVIDFNNIVSNYNRSL